MKKLLAIALAAILLFAVSCTAAPSKDNTADDLTDEILADEPGILASDNGETADNGASVISLDDGTEIEIGAKAEDVLASLGEYSDMIEAPSCVHEGFDRIYTYGGFSVTTSPAGDGSDIVAEFAIESPECKLDNGITVGSTVADMESAFGTDYTNSFGMIEYTLDGMTLTVIVDGENIVSVVFAKA